MTPQSELEIKGNFFTHPFAELITEIAQAALSGSLRLAEKDKKCIVYFKEGRLAFAVSNARETRLFDMLLRSGKLTKEMLVQVPNFSNDFELTAELIKKGVMTESEKDGLFKLQIEGIVTDILSWTDGEWTFSPLARIRDGLSFDVATRGSLVAYARRMSNDALLSRFRTLDETFRRSGVSELNSDLTLEEGFVLSRADDGSMSAADLVSLSAMPETSVLHALYTLWLGGLLIRDNWNPAFSRGVVASIRSAKLELKVEAKERQAPQADPATRLVEPDKPEPEKPLEEPKKEADSEISLEEYLVRIEQAATHYDILGVDSKAETSELKRAYFNLAKNFHPDRYHSEGGNTLKRIQHAFTELAQAHETLKNAESREVYDYRVRKELAEREKRVAAGETGTPNLQGEQATENFERGYSLLMDDDPDGALPFLARAAHFAPQNARYRAFYGRALAYDEKKRHKAESEMQAALKIDPNNPTFRIMLAEFFIQFNLVKRAEGELNRLLAIFPSNREARELLEDLKSKT